MRFGDVASAGVVWLGTNVLAFTTQSYLLVNIGLHVVWLLVVITLVRQHHVRSRERNEESSPVPAPPAQRETAPA